MGKRGKSRKRQGKKVDGDLDQPLDDYEPSESDEEFGKEEKILLDNRRGRKVEDEESEEEVFGIHLSSGEDEEEDDRYYGRGVGSDMDSDIDGKSSDADSEAGLPDSKAWGKNRGRYYNTDYVDKDFGGMTSKDDEELADMEEAEAANIQKRLLSHMEETDFTMGLLDKVQEKMSDIKDKPSEVKSSEKIISDLSQLSSSEKIQLLKQESPELFHLIDDFNENMKLAKDKLLPIINLVKDEKILSCPASNFVQTLFSVILNYSVNIVFYLLLKSKRTGPVDDHPVVHRLFTYKKVLDEMLLVLEEQLINQIDCVIKTSSEKQELEMISTTENEEPIAKNRAERRKRKLKIIEDAAKTEKMIKRKKTKLEAKMDEEIKDDVINSDVEEEDVKFDSEHSEDEDVTTDKRAITYQMKKNKGLTPRRKKEDRNPRVKNKNKYRKAKIRRKGQVRDVRTETERYGGEAFGLKVYLSKSIKIKS